jgi:uncharacterized cupredoxin-like copper-binding protein
MKTYSMFIVAWALAIAAQLALADVGHPPGTKATFGSSGKQSEVTRTVEVSASDNMRFTPGKLDVKRGETIKFVVKNVGKVTHEFSIGDRASQRAHALMMKQMPDMEHGHDPNTISVDPGQTKVILWKFDKKPASPLEIACHEPGHYEAGMKITVALGK